MEHDSSLHKQLTKEITARAVMITKLRMLKADIDKNIEKIDHISREIDRIKKAIRKRGHKDRKHRELSLRIGELNNSKTELKNKRRVKTNNFAHRIGERSSFP